MEIRITKTAIKNIKKLDTPTRERVLNGIYKLPLGDIKRLQGYNNYYRLRVSDFRVIYTIAENTITILSVLPRGEVYKHI